MIQLNIRFSAVSLLVLLLGVWIPRGIHAQTPTPTPDGEFLCNGGTRSGLACNTDDDCVPNGVCVVAQGVCNGGGDDGLTCQCLGGSCPGQPVCSTDATMGTCSNGLFAGQCCDTSFNCADSAPCMGTSKVCLGGGTDFKGLPCLQNSQCNGSQCANTGKFCEGVCVGGASKGTLCNDDTDCPSSTCTSDFQNFSCVDDSDCCVTQPCTPAGICHGTTSSPTNTPLHGTATPTRTRTVSPTRAGSPGTPTATPPAGATATPTPPVGATATRTPSATRTGSPVTSARLVSAVTATDMSISVDNATDFPDIGTFKIDSEQIAYTAKFGNTFVNVQRGVNGSSAAAHASGAFVLFLSATVPTPPPPTATPQPRDVIYRTIGDGSGCALQSQRNAAATPMLIGVAFLAWTLRKRRRY